jgi:hypothetical protein
MNLESKGGNTSIIFSLVNVEGNRGKPSTDPEELAQRS